MSWIVDLLKEIPSAAVYKSKLEDLESSHKNLQEQNALLRSQLNANENAIRDLKEQLVQRQRNRLEDVKEQILTYMSTHQYVLVAQVAQQHGIGIAVAMHHLEALKSQSFVQVSYNAMGESHWRWSVTSDGRSYLVEQDLIS